MDVGGVVFSRLTAVAIRATHPLGRRAPENRHFLASTQGQFIARFRHRSIVTDDRSPTGPNAGAPPDQDEARMRKALGLTDKRSQSEARPSSQAFKQSPASRGGSDAQKRRFVRDGEVQVTMVTGTRGGEVVQQRRTFNPGNPSANEQAEASQSALRSEKSARETAERALREAQATIQDLRTKLGHVALARDEAIETARRAEATRSAFAQELQAVQTRLSIEVFARARAERAAQSLPPLPEDVPPPQSTAREAPEAAPAKRRGRRTNAEIAAAALVAVPVPAVAKRGPGRPRKERPAVVEADPEPIQWWLPKSAKAKSKGRRRSI